MIPKIIHTTWVQGNPPPKYNANVKSWLTYNPGYEVRVWNEEQFFEEMRQDNDWLPDNVMEHYYRLEKYAMKSDVIKIYVLKKYGGLSVDMDMECINSIDKLIGDITTPHVSQVKYTSKILGAILKLPEHGIIYSPPNHPMWDDALIHLQKTTRQWLENSHPYAGLSILEAYYDKELRDKYNIKMFDKHIFVNSKEDVTSETLAIHTGESTWTDGFIPSLAVGFRDGKWVDPLLIVLLLVIIVMVVAYIVYVVRSVRKKYMHSYIMTRDNNSTLNNDPQDYSYDMDSRRSTREI
jgi:mannosyltransferase OCH1-like enzyme